jgi:hypothetical protein
MPGQLCLMTQHYAHKPVRALMQLMASSTRRTEVHDHASVLFYFSQEWLSTSFVTGKQTATYNPSEVQRGARRKLTIILGKNKIKQKHDRHSRSMVIDPPNGYMWMDQWGSTRFTMYFCTSCWAGHKLHESPHRFMRIMLIILGKNKIKQKHDRHSRSMVIDPPNGYMWMPSMPCLGSSQSDQWGSTRFTMYFCTSCWAGHKLHESPHRLIK